MRVELISIHPLRGRFVRPLLTVVAVVCVTVGYGVASVTPAQAAATTGLTSSASSTTIGNAVHDTATLSGATADAGGTITFTAYGPSDSPDCSGNPLFTSTVNVSGSGNYSSGDFTPSTAGSYYWIASYSGDPDNSSASGPCGATNETSTVARATTQIMTAASSQVIGGAIHDTATLTGATASAGGTITFNLYGPSATADCAGAVVFTSTVSVNGNGNYGSGSFTPTTAGKYYWTAAYSGDVNNTGAAGACGAVGETSTLGKATTLLGSSASSASVGAAVHDNATLSGATANAGGTITFTAYGPSDSPDCSGNPLFTSTVNISGSGTYGSGDFTPSTAGSYYWIANYSGDPNNSPASGSCGDQGETSTIARRATALTTAAGGAGGAIHDVATMTGATAGAGGTITFSAYGPSSAASCSGAPVFSETVNVTGPGTYQSSDFGPTRTGTYFWIASYSGDVNNMPSAGSCGDQGESSVVGRVTPSLSTSATSTTLGGSVHDTAVLSGASPSASGTLTFTLYGPSTAVNCHRRPAFTTTVAVHGNGSYTSGSFSTRAPGRYYWVVSYSGDAVNRAVHGGCGDPGETSVIAWPTPPPPSCTQFRAPCVLAVRQVLPGGYN